MANYPKSQQTGELAELAVQQLFTSWGWTVGKDNIDDGYDLFVGPDKDKYKGGRFQVQVKGTSKPKSKGTITAPVSKKRLREYADCLLPVFIMRVTADGGIYWVYAQQWARRHHDRLVGSGASGVKIDKSNDLTDREKFENCLYGAFQESLTLGRPVNSVEKEQTFLNALDSRFDIRIRRTAKGKEHHVFARSEEVEAKLKFVPVKSEKNINDLRDAIQFGLPRNVEVERFEMTGSPVFDQLAAGPSRGTLSIGVNSREKARVNLYPGPKYTATALQLGTDAYFHKGTGGAAISNESIESPIDMLLKFMIEDGRGVGTVTFGLRTSILSARPIAEFDELRVLTDWVDQVFAQKTMCIEAKVGGHRLPLGMPKESFGAMQNHLAWLRTIGRLHLVARSLNSELVLTEEMVLSEADFNDIDMLYLILKGDKPLVNVNDFVIETDASIEKLDGKSMICTTSLDVHIGGKELGLVPVAMELHGYRVERVYGTNDIRIFKDEKSSAMISYDDRETAGLDAVMRRPA